MSACGDHDDGGDPEGGGGHLNGSDDPDGGGGHLNGPLERRNQRMRKAKTFGGIVQPRVKVVVKHCTYLLGEASRMKCLI